MSAQITETEGLPQNDRHAIEAKLNLWQSEGFIQPGWRTAWADDGYCSEVTFQLNYQTHPEAMSGAAFCAFVLGFDARRRAVMARRPRIEHPVRSAR